ncbi:hypothetical protein F7725_009151 [Dissostichus mawsoni]|uniref:Anosmin 1a n=1 Tax=Dissostichus mawsoni TaxID=36200 RepID=A0A7J5Z659_DISMA|nr:hypothetical protein F7725_009151 [Dissostichus mawsoni]
MLQQQSPVCQATYNPGRISSEFPTPFPASLQHTRNKMLAPSSLTVSQSLWIILLCSSAVVCRKSRGGPDDEELWSESVSRATCSSRCLSLHTPLQCLEPCKDSWEMKRQSDCREMCERVFPKKHWECVTSCEFLQSVLAVKQGMCPPPERASGFAAACVESCDNDRECSTQKKCCSNGCGHTCQSPKDLYKGVPLKPRKELGFEELPSGQLEVRWSSRFNISAEPVVYILQRRWNFGIQPSEDTANAWQVVAQTTEQGARLSDTRPGRWYQFRVAAVNSHGTRGFTTPSRHIHSSRDPSSPPAPSELRVSSMIFGSGKAVSTQLQWSMPADLDVPVHSYKVSWSWTAAGQTPSLFLTKRRKTVKEAQVELDSLRANRSYSVEVQAVSYWGQNQLKGPRAVLHFSTQRSKATTRLPGDGSLDVGCHSTRKDSSGFMCTGRAARIPLLNPTESSGNQSTVDRTRQDLERRPAHSFVSLQGLLFSCKYKVILQPVSQKSQILSESTSFFTPSCASIQAKSPKPISCPGDTAASPHRVLLKAANLTASFEVRAGNVTAVFSWEVSAAEPHQQLTGYQVTWAEVIPPTGHNYNQLPHSLISQSQILPPDGNVLVVSGLHPASLYRLEVQTITAEGEGLATSRTFQTPGLQSTRRHRPRLRKHHQQPPIIERH